ncbi:MAG: DUF3050 domain-containing protein [Candidatus Kapaibacteriota bacterium]
MHHPQIEDLRSKLINHALYNSLSTGDDIRRFMETHVFAVWDFMSLLKSLQRNLTCIEIPWMPKGDPEIRQLINEIVLGEECDVNEHGIVMSHFEMYLQAMQELDCNLNPIHTFLDSISKGIPIREALMQANAPKGAQDFVNHTFSIIETGAVHSIAGVFTYGREDLIPGMFLSIIDALQKDGVIRAPKLQYYVQRHIEVDGEHHSHLAIRMVELLCNDDIKKSEAHQAIISALESRIALWDSIIA